MTIAATQGIAILDTWSHQGASKAAKDTYNSIRTALDSYEWPKGVKYEVYLQGSYKNDTNIREDSDVDVVTQLYSSFRGDITSLTPSEQLLYVSSHSDASYGWSQFKGDVLKALKGYYGSNAKEGNKCIKVKTPYLPADVVPCQQYRKYVRFLSLTSQQYVEGMKFYAVKDKRWIINYPKVHYKNGVSKNSQTSGLFKPTVRIFKNARSHLVDAGRIHKDLAPSYFVECFLYNVPSWAFGGSYQHTFYQILKWLKEADFTAFVCQSEQMKLFGNSPEQWSKTDALKFTTELISLWNDLD